MKNMKKIIALLLSLVMIAGLLVSCGDSSNTPSPANSDAGAVESNSGSSSGEAEYTMIVSNSSTDSGYYGAGYRAFISYVEEKSNGRIKCNYFSEGVLANNDRQMYEMTSSGQITLTAADWAGLGEYVGDNRSTFLVMPGFLKPQGDFDEMYYYCDNSKIIADLSEELEAASGIKCLGIWSAGDANIYYNGKAADEVGLAAAMSGLRVRAADKANDTAVVRNLGAECIPMAFSEAYTSIQQKVIEGAIGTFVGFTDYGFNEICNQVLDSQSWTIAYSYMINADFYNSLPADLQEVIDGGIQAGLAEVREGYNDERADAIERVEAAGCHFNALEGDLAKEVAAAHRAAFEERKGALDSEFPGFMDDVIAERNALSEEFYSKN